MTSGKKKRKRFYEVFSIHGTEEANDQCRTKRVRVGLRRGRMGWGCPIQKQIDRKEAQDAKYYARTGITPPVE